VYNVVLLSHLFSGMTKNTTPRPSRTPASGVDLVFLDLL
jgi:hypothetical protein